VETDPASETLCSLQNTRKWTKSINPVIVTAIYKYQNLLEFIRNDASAVVEESNREWPATLGNDQ
jgi:hypothetical protein